MTRAAVFLHNSKQLLIAIDQGLNALAGFIVSMICLLPGVRKAGLWWADETISSHCWRWHINGVRSWPYKIVDAVFWCLGDKGHCEDSYWSEVEGRQLPPEMRDKMKR